MRGSWNETTGKLTISGNDTVANYNKALNSVVFINLLPLNSPLQSTATRTISFQVMDNTLLPSNTSSRDLVFVGTNVTPTVLTNSATALTYNENDPAVAILPGLTIVDSDNINLQSATIKISTNFQPTEDKLLFTTFGKIKGIFQVATGTLVLSGSDTVDNYQKALRTIQYVNSSEKPSALNRTISVTVSDGLASSPVVARTLNVKPINDAPILATNAAIPLAYKPTNGAVAIAPALSVTDVDNETLSSAKIQILSKYEKGKDVLSFVNTATIQGNFDVNTGILTLTGVDTVSNYRAALSSVSYKFVGTASTMTKIVTFTAYDGVTNSPIAARNINVSP